MSPPPRAGWGVLAGLALCVGLFAGSGCATTGGLGSPRTVPAGKIESFVGVEGGVIRSTPFFSPTMRIDAGFRYGLTDDWEIGAHTGGWAFVVGWAHGGAHLKRRILRAPDASRGVDVSLALAGSVDGVYSAGVSGAAYTGQLPVMVGVNLPWEDSVTITGRAVVQHIRSPGSAPITKPMGGLEVGYVAHLWRFTFHPRMGVLMSSNRADLKSNMLVLQSGIEVGFR